MSYQCKNKVIAFRIYERSDKKGINLYFDNGLEKFIKLEDLDKLNSIEPEILNFYKIVYVYPNKVGKRHILNYNYTNDKYNITKYIDGMYVELKGE